jgi:hypothetical protein
MTNDDTPTSDLTIDEKLDRILARLAALESQGAGTTRPLLDRIIQETVTTRETLAARIEELERLMRTIDRRFGVFAVDIARMRADIVDFDQRLADLERRPN